MSAQRAIIRHSDIIIARGARQMTPTVYVIPITCPMLFRPLCDAQRIITN
ncbi:hypothetical protein ACIXOF_09865 [Bacteroides fragilis]